MKIKIIKLCYPQHKGTPRMKMLRIPFKVFFVVSLVILGTETSTLCVANTIIINPSDDGYISKGGSVVTYSKLIVSGNTRGVAEFPISDIDGQIENATLSVNPHALPLWGPVVHVYGYPSNDGLLTSSDYNAGVFLGDWLLPDLGYGEDAYFDITNFLKTITTPYVGFNLRTALYGTDVFSSLEYNHGHPSQLHVVTIPEPATLLLLGLGTVMLRRKR